MDLSANLSKAADFLVSSPAGGMTLEEDRENTNKPPALQFYLSSCCCEWLALD